MICFSIAHYSIQNQHLCNDFRTLTLF